MTTKYKNPPIWAKFGFQVDYDVANRYSSLVCYGGHFGSKMTAKIQKSSDLISMVWEPYYDPLCNSTLIMCRSSMKLWDLEVYLWKINTVCIKSNFM
jgi:ribosomal protein L37AE/L43A